MGRRVALVGFSELSREWANEQPDDVEIWGMNEAHKFLKRWDLWFQIHPRNWNSRLISEKGWTYSVHCLNCGWQETAKPDDAKATAHVKAMGQQHVNRHPGHEAEAGAVRLSTDLYGRTPHHIRWLSQCGVPVVMQAVDERIPTSVKYPMEEISESLGILDQEGKKRLYLTSSVAWMLAYAIWEHKQGKAISEIRTPGVEMLIGTEYARQKPCVEFWLGLATGLGIEWVRPPSGSSLLTDGIYAIDYMEPIQNDAEKVFPIYAKPADDRPFVAIAEHNGRPLGIPEPA